MASIRQLLITVPVTLLIAAGASSSLALEQGKAASTRPVKTAAGAPRELDWDQLIPQASRGAFSAAPAVPAHDYLGEAGPAAQQPLDFNVEKSLDGARVKLPGFIVPLDIGKDGLVSEFFLVPYFGACIHVPPPPPNQIVYVTLSKGIALDSIYEAYWITGKMSLAKKSTRLGAAAYTIAGESVEVYQY